MAHEKVQRARAEGQRRRIIRLLERLTDADQKEQCPHCGRWFKPKGLPSHESSCNGPD